MLDKWDTFSKGKNQFEEVKEDNDMKQFTKDDLRSGMVVEMKWEHNTNPEKYLVIEVNGALLGMNLNGEYWTSGLDGEIIKVWQPPVTTWNGIQYKLEDRYLIYDANTKSEIQTEIEQLKAERDEFNRKMDERLAKLENM